MVLKFLVLLGLACAAVARKLPPEFKICHMSEPNIDKCLQEAIQDAVGRLKNGLPKLGVPSIDPLEVPSLSIGSGGSVNVVQKFKDVKIYGSSEAKIVKVDGSRIKDYVLSVESFVPLITLKAHYNISGRILLFPVKGDGRCTVTLRNVQVDHFLQGESILKKNKPYLNVKTYNVTLKPEAVRFDFENLFDGDERLAAPLRQVVNDHAKDVFEDVRSGYEQSLGLIFQSVANRIFSMVPFQYIFPQ